MCIYTHTIIYIKFYGHNQPPYELRRCACVRHRDPTALLRATGAACPPITTNGYRPTLSALRWPDCRPSARRVASYAILNWPAPVDLGRRQPIVVPVTPAVAQTFPWKRKSSRRPRFPSVTHGHNNINPPHTIFFTTEQIFRADRTNVFFFPSLSAGIDIYCSFAL